MDILSIINKKKHRGILTKDEIEYFIDGFVKTKQIKDYQASALLMAIYLNGLNFKETYDLTKAMLNSGKTIDLTKVKGIKIDKHSTGGVGDKVSLILMPICAALGLKVAKMSGKGLGHTGGTIDKLESVGFKYDLNQSDYVRLLNKVGICISGQTDNIVPADKIIYNLRNATGTVGSKALIAASIVAKKLALKTDYVFLDVKVGDGGFNKTIKDAIELSQLMLNLFKAFHRKAVVHITNMTQPLGRAIGNAIELKAALEFLDNHPESESVKKLIDKFVVDILITTKLVKSKDHARKMIEQIINAKLALKKFND
jgi:pyrimidine-nucleoside phosphorylase